MLVHCGIAQAEVGRKIYDALARANSRRHHLHARSMRQGEKQKVGDFTGPLHVAFGDYTLVDAAQVRIDLVHPLADRGVSGEHYDFHVRVSAQQAQQLDTPITGGSKNGNLHLAHGHVPT